MKKTELEMIVCASLIHAMPNENMQKYHECIKMLKPDHFSTPIFKQIFEAFKDGTLPPRYRRLIEQYSKRLAEGDVGAGGQQ